MAEIIREGSFMAEIGEPPNFFLAFSPDPAKTVRPNPLVVEISVLPQGGMKAPITLSMLTPTLWDVVTLSKNPVNYDEALGAYEKSVMTIDITNIGTDNGAPFEVRVQGKATVPDEPVA